ncbi:DNA helicase [Tanacetum coccineum]
MIGLTLWNEMATEFHIHAYEKIEKPVVIAVASCWVTRYNGLQLSGISTTHYYLNPNIPETFHIREICSSNSRRGRGEFASSLDLLRLPWAEPGMDIVIDPAATDL